MFNTFPLLRFHKAQEEGYPRALAEIKAGLKTTHWIWYIFPQLKHLGQSVTSKYYGLSNLEEAKLFYKNDTLREHLHSCLDALIEHVEHGANVQDIMGEIDTLKLKSCLTLFEVVIRDSDYKYWDSGVITDAVNVLFNGLSCLATLCLLDHPPNRALKSQEKAFLAPYLSDYSSKCPPVILTDSWGFSAADRSLARGLEKLGVLHEYVEEGSKRKHYTLNIFLMQLAYGLVLDSSGYHF